MRKADLSISVKNSIAGRLGAANRWKDHKKLQTTLIRVLKDDSDFIGVLCRRFGVTAAAIVHCCLEHWRDSFIIKKTT